MPIKVANNVWVRRLAKGASCLHPDHNPRVRQTLPVYSVGYYEHGKYRLIDGWYAYRCTLHISPEYLLILIANGEKL